MVAATQCLARDAGHICTEPEGHPGPHRCFCYRYAWGAGDGQEA